MDNSEKFSLREISSAHTDRIIFLALPGLGKTTAVWSFAGQGLDSDVMQQVLLGDQGRGVEDRLGWDYAQTNKRLARLAHVLFSVYPRLHFIASNRNFYAKGFKRVRIVVDPDDYIKIIRKNGRLDLIDTFGEETLKSWAEDAYRVTVDEEIILKPDQYFCDVLDEYYKPKLSVI